MRARSTTLLAAVALAAVLLSDGPGARAQIPLPGSTTTTTTSPPPPSSSSTTTTTQRPSTTTTTTAPPVLPGSSTTTTTAPGSSTTTTTTPGQAGPGGDGAEGTATGPRVVPPEYQSLIAGIQRSKANNTRRLLDALRPLEDLGMTQGEAIALGFGRFPVAGYATFVDDWWFPRFVPTFHLHQGTDIFAASGTPVRSPVDGVLRQANGAVGGLAAYVTQDDGSYVYMAHLAGFAPGFTTGDRVKVGDVVGYVGDTGNARGGSPHVHFELHPAPTKAVTTGKGKNQKTEVVVQPVRAGTVLPPTNPKPYLDRWIAEALARAPQVVSAYQASKPRAVLATGLTRRLSQRNATFSGLSGPPRSHLLWASSANPPGGVLALAGAEASRAAASVDWSARAKDEARRQAAWSQAYARANAVLTPLTP